MHSDLHLHLVRAAVIERRGDPHRVASSTPAVAAARPLPRDRGATMALRLAQPDEAGAVRRLAELDSARPLEGEVLLALADGEPVAALSLADGRAVANPFRSTAHAVDLLRVRAGRLGAASSPRHRFRRPALRARAAA